MQKKDRKTKNGEIFSNKKILAKHKTLALPTIVRVTNLDNGYSINVRINDRGPRNNFRILELSKKAAKYEISMLEATLTGGVHALQNNNMDVVDAIMGLTMK